MTIADVILYHIQQAGEADACNEKEQAEMHTQMAVVLFERLAS
jgi:hypothetical protein